MIGAKAGDFDRFHPGGRSDPAVPFILGYIAAVFLGIAVLTPQGVQPLWSANGILASALLVLDRRAALRTAAVCVLAEIITTLSVGASVSQAIALPALNLLECLCLVWMTRQVSGPNLNFSEGRRLAAFVLGAASPSCLLVGGVLAGMVALGWLDLGPNVAEHWFVTHLIGVVVVMPAVTVIADRRRFRALPGRSWELAAALVVLAGAVAAVYSVRALPPIAIGAIFPLTVLIAFRHGPVGASASSLVIATVASLSLLIEAAGARVGLEQRAEQVMMVQVTVLLTFLTSMPLAGAVASFARMRQLLARRSAVARDARRRADAGAAAKSEFLANMSHEIRTPLNGVIGLADALARTELSPHQREMLRMILTSGKALTGLLSDALDLARADSGALKLEHEPFDVRETVGASAFLFKAIAREKGLEFSVDFDIDPPGGAVGDALRIRQVIANLISNAVKFTSQGSVSVQVSLKALPDGDAMLKAVVRDTGQGFDATVKARLFKRFEQGDSSVTRRYGGSGLGLSIAHRLCTMMGGELVCDSTPGVGSIFVFTVRLPAAAAPGETAPVDVAAPMKRRLAVLLAEDHPVNQRVIRTLIGESANLTVAANGQEALDLWESRPFDLILMDTHMPLLDGLSATRLIRAREQAQGRAPTPIISLTADAMPQQVEGALAAGADLHLAKPVTAERLFAAMSTALELGREDRSEVA